MCLPVRRMSAAAAYGIWRRRRTADPPIGYKDHRASDTPKRALSPATADVGALQDLGAAGDGDALDRGDHRLRRAVRLEQPAVDEPGILLHPRVGVDGVGLGDVTRERAQVHARTRSRPPRR